jgi:hypothetical protein
MLERWHNEDPSPVMQQWEALRARGAPAITPITQEALWQMRQELAAIERAKPQPPRDENLIAAKKELSGAVGRYRAAHTYIIEAQQKLQRLATDLIYTLIFRMGEILQAPISPQDWLDGHFATGRATVEDLNRIRQPTFVSTADYRAATNLVSDAARELEDRQAAIIEVCRFSSDDASEKLRRITLGLLQRDRIPSDCRPITTPR